MKQLPTHYCITDRTLCRKHQLLPAVHKILSEGIRMIQIREKDLETRELYSLTRKIKTLCRKKKVKVLINSRVDIALSLNLDGVHFTQQPSPLSLPEARLLLGKNKLIGQSCHSLKEALQAEKEGATFITFGPINLTPSKLKYGKPLGFKKLKTVCRKLKIPVYALGGIHKEDLKKVQKLGARGIAGIRTFF